jgi:uncharacterized protein
MIILLSPAKSIDTSAMHEDITMSEPRFGHETQALLKVMKKLKSEDLQNLMEISVKLGDLNALRFKHFFDQDALAAAMLFDGDVYEGLKARELERDSLHFAQDHVRILSGLYGLLRPLDATRPYRLEMGTALETTKGHTLYSFWDQKIAKQINLDAKAVGTDTVLNLASQEYAKAALNKALKLKVIEVKFLELKSDKAQMVSFFAKRARGLMARFLIDNQITEARFIKDFNTDGYRFQPEDSTDTAYVFSRKYPSS